MEIALSSLQKSVVNFEGDYLLVVAGAGSGKTRVLTERIKKTITSLKHGEKILAITFSNKASEELKDRLDASLGYEIVEEFTYIGTIHRFCLEIVSSRGSLIGLPDNLQICDSSSDRVKIFLNAINAIPEVKEFIMQYDPKDRQKKITDLLETISKAKRDLRVSSENLSKPLMQKLLDEYDSALLKQGVIDFDDILRYAYQILTERNNVTKIYRQIYKNIFVDEAQDLNKAQYEIIKVLCGNSSKLTMVGDPNQSIFGFNGSSNEFLTICFEKDFNAVRIVLNENYRSSKLVLDAANKLEPTFEADGLCAYNGEFQIHSFKNEDDEAEYIVRKIQNLLEHGHEDIENQSVFLSDIVVIARNRYVFNKLENKLIEQNLKYMLKVSSKGSFSSESEFIKVFELGLKLMVNNKDLIHIDEICHIMKFEHEISSFQDLRKVETKDKSWEKKLKFMNLAWERLPKDIAEFNFLESIKPLKQIFDELHEDMDENEKLLINNDIFCWEQNWKNFVKSSTIGERTLPNFIRAASLGSSSQVSNDGITLSTVHMSKGLEFNIVFIMGLDEGVFPDYRAVLAEREGNNSSMIEERHNMFVAITRSKRLCYLTYPREKNTPWGVKTQYPSRFIKDLSK